MEVWLGLLYGVPADQLVDVARAAEELGFHGIALPDHIAVPVDFVTEGPPGHDEFKAYIGATGYWLDPLISIAAMGAATTRLRFLTFAFVLPYRHPAVVAKSVATTAILTNYRLDFGVAVGWLKEEADLFGVPWNARGRQMDEMLEILVDFWEDGYAEFHGEFYDFPRTAMFPMPQKKINIFVGGSADVALRRAARFDGFLPMDPVPGLELAGRVLELRAKGAPAGPFQVFLVRSCFGDTPLEFGQIAALEQDGVTGILLNVWPYFDELYATLDAKLSAAQNASRALRLDGRGLMESGA